LSSCQKSKAEMGSSRRNLWRASCVIRSSKTPTGDPHGSWEENGFPTETLPSWTTKDKWGHSVGRLSESQKSTWQEIGW
jgi:hypothetical protein